ncbi:MAG: helix-turn-helix domain-containing protein [Candidatus Kapabacteria bacterium]|nr:helix-turn-helix domain-containing protein [Ignavibacteriota bacterium]MCW5886398.1 helix-turn-helix domain-containing protein [Candidatus Kapabacteria bacterium]
MLTKKQAADKLGVSTRTIERYEANGIIRPVKLLLRSNGNYTKRYKEKELLKILEGN